MGSITATRTDLLALALVFAALAILVFGQLFVGRSGAYLYVAEEPTPEAELAGDAPVVDFEALSPSMQQKFERRLGGERTYVGPEERAEDELPWGLYRRGYVRYQGALHETGMTVAHPPVSRSLITGIGGALLAIGALLEGAHWRRRSRPPFG